MHVLMLLISSGRAVAFNSLFEMLTKGNIPESLAESVLSILYLRCIPRGYQRNQCYYYPFNSLFEMQGYDDGADLRTL